jgi:tetratricopeptide (TPR) repeat protein
LRPTWRPPRDVTGRGDHAAAARLANRAVTLNPLRDDYLAMEGQAQERSAGGAIEPEEALERAVETYETLHRRFEPSAYHTLLLAMAAHQLAQLENTPVEDTFELFEEAVGLDPYNAPLRQFVADHYERLGLDDRVLEHRLEVLCWEVVCE